MPEIGQGRSLFDDTPVNGQLEKGISSNWAFDEDATLRALIEATLPWLIQIDPFLNPKAQTAFATLGGYGAQLYAGVKASDASQNALITWDVVLAAGTWTISLLCQDQNNNGIYSVQLDSVEVGTLDGYNVTATYNVIKSITGITIPATKKIEFTLKMATKNGASSAYRGAISHIQFLRTA